MKISEFIANYLVEKFKVSTAFVITGGGAMYLNDAFGNHPKLNCIYMHHEQSLAMASEAYARVKGSLAVCQITTGPGGTNAVSGCAGAWIDSEPILFISGQVESFSRIRNGERQSGVQEVDILRMVRPITKLAVDLKDPFLIKYELDRLVHEALTGRKGPVWLDVPLEMQNYEIGDPEALLSYSPVALDARIEQIEKNKYSKALEYLQSSKKPVICIGGGCADLRDEIERIADKLKVPIVVGWNGKDLINRDYEYLMGSAGLFGNRAANILISESDLIIGIGYRFSVPQIGYNPYEYIKNKKIISVDIDSSELAKCESFIDFPIKSYAKDFIEDLLVKEVNLKDISGWRLWAKYLKNFGFDKKIRDSKNINSFDFTYFLEKRLIKNDVIVTDMGTSFTCTHQFLNIPKGVRMFTSSGLAAMGFGLPGAIGACIGNDRGRTILVTGDGGLMFNLQELQTIKTYGLNLKLIVYENGGYLTMKHMQKARFGNLVGSDPTSKVECPNFDRVFNAFEIASKSISLFEEMDEGIDWLFQNQNQAAALIVHLNPWQELTPRVQTRSDIDGRLFPSTLDSMFPYLEEKIVKTLNQKKIEFLGKDYA